MLNVKQTSWPGGGLNSHMVSVGAGSLWSGHEGRIGMAAVTLREGEDLDRADVYKQVVNYLPTYARPRFIRIQVGTVLNTAESNTVQIFLSCSSSDLMSWKKSSFPFTPNPRNTQGEGRWGSVSAEGHINQTYLDPGPFGASSGHQGGFQTCPSTRGRREQWFKESCNLLKLSEINKTGVGPSVWWMSPGGLLSWKGPADEI